MAGRCATRRRATAASKEEIDAASFSTQLVTEMKKLAEEEFEAGGDSSIFSVTLNAASLFSSPRPQVSIQ